MENYQEEQQKSSGSAAKWFIVAGVLCATAIAGAAIGIPSFAKYKNKQFCKDFTTEFNHAMIKTNISADFKRDESAGSFLGDVYRYDFYNGSAKIFTLVQDNSYGLTSVDSVVTVDGNSLDISNTGLIDYLKTLKIESNYSFLQDTVDSKFVVPAYSFKDGDISASWSDAVWESSFSKVSEGIEGARRKSLRSQIKSLTIEAPDFRVNLANMNSDEKNGSLDEFGFYLIGDKPVAPAANEDAQAETATVESQEETAAAAAENAQESAANENVNGNAPVEPAVEKGVVGSVVVKKMKVVAPEPDFNAFTSGKVSGESEVSVGSFVYDLDDVYLDFENSNLKISIDNVNGSEYVNICGRRSYQSCIQGLDPQSQMNLMFKVMSGASMKISFTTVLNNGKIVFDNVFDFGQLNNQMDMVQNTRVDSHLEFDKALMSRLADDFEVFGMVQQFISENDKNKFADKYVTNFMCTKGLSSCTLNGTPIENIH